MGKAAFDALPTIPKPFVASGTVVMLVSFSEGALVAATPGYDEIKKLRSFTSISETVIPGKPLKLTVDLFDCAGVVVLVHDTAKVVEEDLALIRRMEEDCTLFELSRKRPRKVSRDFTRPRTASFE